MAKTMRIDREKRGIFGVIALTLFLAFNFFMAFLTWASVSSAVDIVGMQETGFDKAASSIGGGAFIGVVLFLWVFGAIILGIFALLTRGKKIITELD